MKKLITIIIFLILLTLGARYFFAKENNVVEKASNLDPRNTTYLINEEEFTLVDGSTEKEVTPDSVVKNKVSIFGEPAFGDIDKDGDEDAVLILVNEPGGSGIFYYAAIAVNVNGEYKGTDTILLGDRIAPQTYYMQDNLAIVNYVVRGLDEPFSVQPSFGKSLWLQFDPESLRLIQVEVNFSGEADPNIMTLDMKPWTWIKTNYNNDTELTPENKEAFVLTFLDGNNFSATTDCNSTGGNYEVNDNQIIFNNIISTMMFCEDSQEQDFLEMLSEVDSFMFTGKGELILELKLDSGSSTFK